MYVSPKGGDENKFSRFKSFRKTKAQVVNLTYWRFFSSKKQRST
ncbi:hypothetical protein EV11_1896 [Prochlorococcus sp. SS52]|nr:hypothetical protein EV04_1757 [Prochlorococcus marinus str. LG]KGG20144.1 hypothetical protein EV08_1170 [Prochlorococcus marinus str. SS2]KGG24044.1 hypothetical protein EV09_0648 [Prochlorococcus marinus str. SS35]KGG31697.1 hypothetical protein EV10_1794 [Prochlorococcus marinus str. SS51]KGG34764.1 hypothetical protein EV11_1896 [Prochlorococcus sp. SS52]